MNRLIFFFFLIFIGCKGGDSPIFMAFEDVEYISSFPQEISLMDPQIPNVNNLGLRELQIFEDILFLEKMDVGNGIWDLYRLPDYEPLGRFLKRGDGPLEFMQGPNVSNKNSFLVENREIIAYIYDFQKGRVKKFNVTKSIFTDSLNMESLEVELPRYAFTFSKIEKNQFVIKEINVIQTQQIRYLVNEEGKIRLPIFEKLDSARVIEGEDFNLLSTLSNYNSKNKRVVEAPIRLNNINIYSLDGSFSKTLCLEDKLSDLNEIQNEFRWNRKYTFADLKIFDDFFGVIYVNEEISSYQDNRSVIPSLLLFDWEGNPLASINTGKHMTAFDIDVVNKKLYTFDAKTDEFLVYDLSQKLSF